MSPREQRAAAWRAFMRLSPQQRRKVPLERMPGCWTCGERPVGTFSDGSPRFALEHRHGEGTHV